MDDYPCDMRLKAELKWGGLSLDELVEYTEIPEPRVRAGLGMLYARGEAEPYTHVFTGDTNWTLVER